MARIEENLIEKARKVDFMVFLEKQEGWHFEKRSIGCYRCIEHDSFILNEKGDFLWYNWYSKSEKGNIISYVQNHITNGDFRGAIEYILNSDCGYYSNKEEKETIKGDVQIHLNNNMKRMFAYLIKKRMIDYKIINELVRQGKIVQDTSNNVVFKYIDEKGNTVGGEVKGSCSYKSYIGVVGNSNESYGFTVKIGENIKNLIVFEAAIDLLSYLQIFKTQLDDCILLSLAGATKTNKIATYLKHFKNINTITVCMDNDSTGNDSMDKIKLDYKDYEILDGRELIIKNQVKDFNELLINGNVK